VTDFEPNGGVPKNIYAKIGDEVDHRGLFGVEK
jgi:hypothetical protein